MSADDRWGFTPPDDSWVVEQELPTLRLFRLPDDLLVINPQRGQVDDEQTARVCRDALRAYAAALERPVRVAVLMDNTVNQTAGARDVWSSITPDWYGCCALISNSILSRAMVSFFNGIRRPVVPTRVFATLDEGLAWLRTQP